MTGPGGAEVGRVHIRVVPDFTKFRKEMGEELAFWSNKDIVWNLKVDKSQLDTLTKDLGNSAKTASRQLEKDLTTGVRKATAKAGKKAAIEPRLTGNKARLVNRLRGDLNRVLSGLETRLAVQGFDASQLRAAWDQEEAYFNKRLSKITPKMGPIDLYLISQELETYLESLKRRSLDIPVRYEFEDSLKKWLAAEKEHVNRVNAINKQAADGMLNSKSELQAGLNKIREQTAEMQRLARAAEAGRLATDQLFLSTSKKDQRQAFREYIFGFRDMQAEIDKTGGQFRDLFSEKNQKKAGWKDSTRMRGGLLGAMLGGVGAIAGAKAILGNLAKAGAEAGKSVGGLFSKFAEFGGKFKPSFGTGVNLAGKAYIAAAAILVAAPAIGLVSAAVLTLPGLIALVATPIAALTLGLDGLKRAAEVLKEPFENLKTVMSARVEEQFTPIFEKLRNLFPTLEAALPTVTGGLAKIGDDIANFLTSDEGKKTIDDTIRGIGASLTQVAPGVRDFTAAIMGLAKEFVTGGALEGLGTWFVDTMADFRNWVNNADLTGMFKGLGDTLKVIVDWLGQIAQTGLEFVADPAKMNGFLATLENIGDFLADLVDLSSTLAGVWDAITFPMDKLSGGIDILSDAARSIPVVGDAWDWLLPDDWTVLNRKANEAGSAARISFMNGLNETIDASNEAGLMLGSDMYSNLTAGASEAVQEIATELAGAGEKWQTQLEGSLNANQVQTAVAGQIQAQVGAAVNGSLQALVPLKEGLQNDINLALAPLGDIPGRLGTAFNNVGTIIGEKLRSVPSIVSNALGSLPGVTALAMVPLNQEVQKGCDAALLTATFMAPKIIEPFRDLGGQMGQVGADMMNGLAIGIRDNASIASQAASVAAAAVLAAAKLAVDSESPSKDFMKLGGDLNAGMAIGIDKSGAGPISAIREVMQAIKDVFGTAEGLNLNFFMGQAATSMSNMATSSKEFRSNMVEAGTSPAVSSGLGADQIDNIKLQKAELDVKIAELQAQKNATADKAAKAALTSEIDQLKIQKERLDLLKEESGLQEDRKTAIQQLSDTIATNITDMIKMPGDFAKATVSAAAQDLGISGSGAIPTIANWALDAGTNYIFNVNNMDDAIQGQQAQQRVQALGVTG